MAYNYTNPFNNVYNPSYAPGGPLVPQIPTSSNPQHDLIFVLDENAARSYPVANGQKITLWDKNYPKFYIKSVDQNGIPSFRKFNFTEELDEPAIESAKPVQTVTDEYITKADFEAFANKIFDKLNERPVYYKKPQNNKEG